MAQVVVDGAASQDDVDRGTEEGLEAAGLVAVLLLVGLTGAGLVQVEQLLTALDDGEGPQQCQGGQSDDDEDHRRADGVAEHAGGPHRGADAQHEGQDHLGTGRLGHGPAENGERSDTEDQDAQAGETEAQELSLQTGVPVQGVHDGHAERNGQDPTDGTTEHVFPPQETATRRGAR